MIEFSLNQNDLEKNCVASKYSELPFITFGLENPKSSRADPISCWDLNRLFKTKMHFIHLFQMQTLIVPWMKS